MCVRDVLREDWPGRRFTDPPPNFGQRCGEARSSRACLIRAEPEPGFSRFPLALHHQRHVPPCPLCCSPPPGRGPLARCSRKAHVAWRVQGTSKMFTAVGGILLTCPSMWTAPPLCLREEGPFRCQGRIIHAHWLRSPFRRYLLPAVRMTSSLFAWTILTMYCLQVEVWQGIENRAGCAATVDYPLYTGDHSGIRW